MSTLPVLGQITDIYSFGALVQRVIDTLNEPIGPKSKAKIEGYVNDAIESVWMSALLASLSKFTRGPVTQIFPAGETSVPVVSIPDPTSTLVISSQPGGGSLSPRTLYFSFCYVTDSGSTTLPSPITSFVCPAGQVAIVIPPPFVSDSIGYYLFAGVLPSGLDQGLQTPAPLSFSSPFYEPPAFITPAPKSPVPPTSNTTADNILAIKRIDVLNVDQTWTNWIQTNVSSSWFTEFQHKVSTTTTWMPFVYDFIDNRQIEVRPAPAAPLTGAAFFTTRPRRLRYPQSRLPFTSFACQAFLHDFSVSKMMASIYEWEAAQWWKQQAEDERKRILLQIGAGNWDQNTTIRPFAR